jgi:hypothetical protein
MVKPLDRPLFHLSLEDVAMRASHKVLMEVDENILPTVVNIKWILYQQLRPHQVHLLNIIIIILINYIKLFKN